MQELLNEISLEGRLPKHTELTDLSGLTREELAPFEEAWKAFDASLKREVLERLLNMAEANLDMDFTSVFRHCLWDADPVVRERSIQGLWECAERSLIGPFIDFLKEDPSERVRASSTIALGKFAELSEKGKLLSKDGPVIMGAILEVMHAEDETAEVKRRAMESMAPFNTEEVHRIIENAYSSDDLPMRCSAVFAMGRSGDPRWLSTIIKETESAITAMRYEAANACGELGDEEAVPHLIPLVQEKDLQVQLAAVNAMGAIGGPLARRALQRCLQMEDETIKEAARESLAYLELEDDPLLFRHDL